MGVFIIARHILLWLALPCFLVSSTPLLFHDHDDASLRHVLEDSHAAEAGHFDTSQSHDLETQHAAGSHMHLKRDLGLLSRSSLKEKPGKDMVTTIVDTVGTGTEERVSSFRRAPRTSHQRIALSAFSGLSPPLT